MKPGLRRRREDLISKSAVAGCSKNGRSRQCCVHTTGGRERADAGFAAEAVRCPAPVCQALRVAIRIRSPCGGVRRPDAGVRAKAQPGRDPARLPSSFFTMSNSLLRGLHRAASPVPAAHVLRPGCQVRFVSTASPLPSPTAARACARNLGRHQLRPRTGGPAERREAHYLELCRAGKTRRHACEA
jgi:hypothetical protein